MAELYHVNYEANKFNIFDDEDESKELSEKLGKLSMDSWIKLTKTIDESNAASLTEEAEQTLEKVDSFLKSFELFARITGKSKRRRRIFRGTQIQKTFDRMFNERVSLGMYIMEKIIELFRLERLDNSIYSIFSSSASSLSKKRGSICDFELTLQKYLTRFVLILDEKGIPHDLPVSINRTTINDERQIDTFESQEFLEVLIPPASQSPEEKEKEIENSIEFLNQVAKINNITLMFRNVPQKDSRYEYFYACDFDQFTVTGKGPTRLTARMNSASKMIKLIMKEQLKGNSIAVEKFAILTDEQFDTAIKILCQSENFTLRLRKVCEMHTAHLPKYIMLEDKPVYTFRCEALGYKAIGHHKKSSIAKRMAAKKLLLLLPNAGYEKVKNEFHRLNVIRKKKDKLRSTTTFRETTLA